MRGRALLLALAHASALRLGGDVARARCSASAALAPTSKLRWEMQAAPQIAKPKTQIKHSTGYSTGDSGGQGGAEDKIAGTEEAGIRVSPSPSLLGQTLAELLETV